MNKERFEQARQTVLHSERIRDGIGTLGDKTLHAVLKRYMEPYEGSHEIKIGSYVADIVGEDGIIEIQTQGFDKLRKKLTAFLEVSTVTVVYAIASTKWLTPKPERPQQDAKVPNAVWRSRISLSCDGWRSKR